MPGEKVLLQIVLPHMNPKLFALIVTVGMGAAGVILGVIIDRVMGCLGLQVSRRGKS